MPAQTLIPSDLPAGRSESYDVSVDLDPARCYDYLRSGQTGQTREQSMLAREILEKDADIAQAWSVRSAALQGLQWELQGGTPEARAYAKRALLNISPEVDSGLSGFRALIAELVLSSMHGFTVSRIQWGTGGASIIGFELVPHHWFNVDLALNLPKISMNDQEIVPSGSQWIVHRHLWRGSSIARSGLVRPLGYIYAFKRAVQIHMLRYSEKFGMPFVSATVPERAEDLNNELRFAYERMLTNLSADGTMVAPSDFTLNFLQPNGASVDIYEGILNFYSRQVFRLLLGQDSTSSSENSNRSTAAVHNLIRRDILTHDALGVAETITAQLIRPLIRQALGEQDEYPRFAFELEGSTQLEERSKAALALHQVAQASGFSVAQVDLEKALGVPLFAQESSRANLSAQIGVGGTQSLVQIVVDPNLNESQKIGLMGLLFGVSEEDAKKALGADRVPVNPPSTIEQTGGAK